MRILFIGLFLASLVSIGLFASGFEGRREAASAPSAAGRGDGQAPTAPGRPADERQPKTADSVAAAIETLRGLLPGAEAEDEAGSGSSGGNVYYQWTDSRGSVHIVQSLEEVPAEWRGRAGRIEMASRPKAKARRVASRAPDAAPSAAAGPRGQQGRGGLHGHLVWLVPQDPGLAR